MKSVLLATLINIIIEHVSASYMNQLLGLQAGCNRDNCFRAVLGSRPGPASAFADCSSWMQVTETPCASTVTETATVTSFTTTLANPFPGISNMKRGQLEDRQVSSTPLGTTSCTVLKNSPSSLAAYIQTACPSVGTFAPSARYSTACSCAGVTAATTTLAASITTVTTTSTFLTAYTPTNTPTAFILQTSIDRNLYVSVDDTGALRLVRNATAATPFYIDDAREMRNLNSPNKTFVNYYDPDPYTADDKVYSDVEGPGKYQINCGIVGRVDGGFYGNCQSSGSPSGNPDVYGFSSCSYHGEYVYMTPNFSNVRCRPGGFTFSGFYLKTYTGNQAGGGK
ncbi:FAD dependent oxidoreductase [Colletotrichum truncatum]|uniref:FAD dependent oxidoreductase n=1 Tax=Colletotrichum truncatum TaxID=5467 RepID=A0ACC3YFF2_COLTU|nr:FAD dependent oxidoreductase [Colletotrichum truncatum]KAF6790220.1 FAD dependent oxidoreductase [Colletotrichum truncatum]